MWCETCTAVVAVVEMAVVVVWDRLAVVEEKEVVDSPPLSPSPQHRRVDWIGEQR